MRFYLELICLCLLLSVLTVQAQDEPRHYRTVGNWDIRIDPSLGNGCFALVGYEGDTALRIGLDMDGQSVYLVVGDPSWQSIEYGKKYDVSIVFGDESPWTGDASGFSFNPPTDEPYLWVEVAEGDAIDLFVDEFMREQNFQLFYNDESIVKLTLKGSYKAGLALIECQQEAIQSGSDPFSEGPARSRDPFEG